MFSQDLLLDKFEEKLLGEKDKKNGLRDGKQEEAISALYRSRFVLLFSFFVVKYV